MVSVCPVGVARAPLERVWSILLDSSGYGDWTDADVHRAAPPGPAAPGQLLEATTRAAGMTFKVRLTVVAVEPERHRLAFDVDLPFGLTERASITLAPVGG